MRWIEILRMRLQMLFGRNRAAQRLDQELQFHLEQQIAENRAAGMSAQEAHYAALRLFGNPATLRDQTRDTWSWSWLAALLRDIRIATRRLLRTPGFSLTAVLIMSLAIGANVTLFTVVRSVLLRPLPFPDPDRLIMLYGQNQLGNPKAGNVVAPGDFFEWQKGAHGFEQMAIWQITGFNLAGTGNDLPEFVDAGASSWNLLSTLGVQPALGQGFTATDDQVGAPPAALLTWNFFQRRFNADPSVIGHTIRMNEKPYLVRGVLPRGFNYPDPKIQLWVPIQGEHSREYLHSHYVHTSHVVARLLPNVSASAAVAEVGAIEHLIYLRFNSGGPVAQSVMSRSLMEDVVGDARTPLYTLMAAVGCLLLIGCLNLSNLLVARAAARRRESAICAALGCSRAGLLRQQLAESLLICIAGGALGMLLATAATHWVVLRWTQMPSAEAVHPDLGVLCFALAIIFLAGLLAGTLPVLSGGTRQLLSALQESARGTRGGASRARLRKALLTIEVALTVVLLVGAGLLFRSFIALRSDHLGCTTRNVLTLNFFLRGDKYHNPAQIAAFQSQLLERVRQIPGIQAAGLTDAVPGDGYYGDLEVKVAGRAPLPGGQHRFALYRTADPGYFSALQIPLIRGRFFSESERLDNSKYVIVNQQFARDFFPGEDPLGHHILLQSPQGELNLEIVGIVGDTLYKIGQPVRAMMWFPILTGEPMMSGDDTLVVRTSSHPEEYALRIQRTIASLDAELPVKRVLTMDQLIGRSTADSSFNATLVVIFAAVSLLLAAVGLYGVLAYLVAQRTTEIGVRMALGAARASVLRLVLVDGLRPALAGLFLGIAASLAITRLIASQLYATSPLDTSVFVASGVGLLIVACVACFLPAWRASQMNPIAALRTE